MRRPVRGRGKASRRFSKDVRDVHRLNVAAAPRRGGWRL